MVSQTTTIRTPVKKVQILEDRMPRTDDTPSLTRNVFMFYSQEQWASRLYAAADAKNEVVLT
jgi:hypothetical protein